MSGELDSAKRHLRNTAYQLLEAIFHGHHADVELLAAEIVTLATHVRQIEKRNNG